MEKVWFNEIKNGDDRFIAYGPGKDFRDVFQVTSNSHVTTTIKFPSCIRFMPYSEVTKDEKIETDEILKEFGPLLQPGEIPDGQDS